MSARGRTGRLGPAGRALVAACLLALPFLESAANDPRADPAATVVAGRARFTVLTPQLLRLEWSEDGRFEDRASLAFVNRRLPVPAFEIDRDDSWLTIRTRDVELRYRQDAAFTPASLNVTLSVGGSTRRWTPGSAPNGNLGGTVRTVDGFEGRRKLDDGSELALEPGILSRDGWSLIDDTQRLLFDGEPADNRVAARQPGERVDWYLFAHGRDYRAALADFVAVAGRIPMPPRFAFGYWWSRYWAYSDAELRALVASLDDYAIPRDVLIVDMDWHETHGLTSKAPARTPFGGMLGWTGYTWNRALFPDPERFLDWTEARQLKVALNLHPSDGIAPFEASYDAMREALGEAAPADGEWIEYRLSDPDWARAYFDTVLRPHEDIGVDFWWLDWQQWSESRHVAGLDNMFWLNHAFFTDMERRYPGRRPLLFHRWGGLGNHRYQVGFSGDAVISWRTLAFQPAFTATASNVAYGYWSHDIGGHIVADSETAIDGELYLRWLQYGALSPILRTHASKSAVAERRIWMYPRHFADMREAIRLRYRLVPYLYNAARVAYDTGVAITRPMYYAHPENDRAYEVPQQYMLGEDLLVAPVTTPADDATALATQSVWLPAGRWFELDTGRLLDGERTIRRTVALDEIPIYVRAGSIVPMLPVGTRSLQTPAGVTELAIFPGASGRLRYYEDDGHSQDYKRDVAARTDVRTRLGDGELDVTIGAVEGGYDGMPASRTLRLRLVGVAPLAEARLNGAPLGRGALRYEASELTQLVDLPLLPNDAAQTVELRWTGDDADLHARIAGKAGVMRRLQRLGERIKALSAREDWAATVPNEISRLIETPTRIAYREETLATELVALELGLQRLEQLIDGMPQISGREGQALARYLDFEAH